jgi:ATP-dependent RNA helicase DDX10/DBP4
MLFYSFHFTLFSVIGLRKSKYFLLAEIQQQVIPIALQGKDILACGKTGSGKTLCFLVPVCPLLSILTFTIPPTLMVQLLELLYREKWSSAFGLGALIIVPTRELALQIFETLRKVGEFHDFPLE